MFVADAGIGLWVVAVLLVGLLGFFLVVATLVVRVATLVVRFLGWVLPVLTGRRQRPTRVDSPPNPGRQMICPHVGCGHVNGPLALYCARCGRPLHSA